MKLKDILLSAFFLALFVLGSTGCVGPGYHGIALMHVRGALDEHLTTNGADCTVGGLAAHEYRLRNALANDEDAANAEDKKHWYTNRQLHAYETGRDSALANAMDDARQLCEVR